MGWGEPQRQRPHASGVVVIEVAAADHLAAVETERDDFKRLVRFLTRRPDTVDPLIPPRTWIEWDDQCGWMLACWAGEPGETDIIVRPLAEAAPSLARLIDGAD